METRLAGSCSNAPASSWTGTGRQSYEDTRHLFAFVFSPPECRCSPGQLGAPRGPLQLSYSGSSCSSLIAILLASSVKQTASDSARRHGVKRVCLPFTFGQLQVKRVERLLQVAAGRHAFQLVTQLLQLDVEVDLVLSAGELSTAGAGRRHQVTHLQRGTADCRLCRLRSGLVRFYSLSLSQGSCRAADQTPGSWPSHQTSLCRRSHKYLDTHTHRCSHTVRLQKESGAAPLPFPLNAAIRGLYFCSLSSSWRPPSLISLLTHKHRGYQRSSAKEPRLCLQLTWKGPCCPAWSSPPCW